MASRWDQPPRQGTLCDVYDGPWDTRVGSLSWDAPSSDCDHEAVETVYAVNTKSDQPCPLWLCGCCVERLAKQGRIRRNGKRRKDPTWKCPT